MVESSTTLQHLAVQLNVAPEFIFETLTDQVWLEFWVYVGIFFLLFLPLAFVLKITYVLWLRYRDGNVTAKKGVEEKLVVYVMVSGMIAATQLAMAVICLQTFLHPEYVVIKSGLKLLQAY